MLGAHYDELEKLLAWPTEVLHGRVPAVSSWSPAQQLSHILLSNAAILGALRKIAVDHEKALKNQNARCRWIGSLVLGAGRIPRGRARSPAAFVAEDAPDTRDLEGRLKASRDEYEALQPLLQSLAARRGRFPHPMFGMFKGSQWMRLMRIHAGHHLAIVRDIRAGLGGA